MGALPAAPTAAIEAAGTVEVAAASAAAEVTEVAKPTLDHAQVSETIMNLAKEVVGDADDVHADSALMDAGMDSLSAVAFRNSLMRAIKGVNLPASLMFDYPTVNQIADYIVEESSR